MANSLSAFNAQVWSQAIIRNLDRINVMLPHTNRQWDGVLNSVGDTVQVRTLGSVTTGSYSKGQTISYQGLSPVKEALTVSDSVYFAFQVDDIDKVQNDHDALMLYAQRAAVAINNAVEDKILSSYASCLAANQITNTGSPITLTSTTAGTSVYDNLVLARENLSKQNVPLNQPRWVVVNPATASLLLKDTVHFIRSTDLGDKVAQMGTVDGLPARPGFLGMCAGFEVYESNAVPSDASGKYLVYGDDMAIAYVAQLQEVEQIRLQDTFAWAIRGLLLHDVKVFAEASKRLGYIYAA